MDKTEYLQGIYEDLQHVASYSGVDKLYNYVKKNGNRHDITRKDVDDFLKIQPGYTYHGTVPRSFVRRPIKVSRPGSILGTDICDMTSSIASHNKGYRYILVLIDCFSRKVNLTPLKNKTCANFAIALEKYLENSPHQYSHVFSDEGGEFLGSKAKKVYEKFHITRYSVHSRKFKCSIAERFIRTLKQYLYRYFTQNNTFNYINVLHKFEIKYNSTPHMGLGLQTPDRIHNLTDLNEIKEQEIIQLRQKFKNYGSISRNELKKSSSSSQVFEVGTHVRLLLTDAERVFGKSYEKIFTDEIFMIRKVDRELPVSYWVSDLKNRPIKGVVYHRKMKQVELPDTYYVEKIVKTTVDPVTGKNKYLVRWTGFSEDFDSYVDEIYKL